ncbi:hypothetical protein EG68_07440 [Paragonimus skrjabini miyazakii]|uniref:Dynein regulatory complex subunit 4 n=1 Tax=Paragonimus skrjabini miyazakii TaxID=59628 RepID=A0A8S9YJU9_9TREM|nr:hypothetical protein EG68_07440 [Paragonimus skrjabini miyazakii]
MPPKRKGGKKKGKKSSKSKTPTVVDGVSTVEMSHEQLEEHIIRLREELEREREERNYFQLEKDKITNFWEITKHQLEERSSELRNKEREAEEAEERHQLELKVYKQKVKHLLYEHQNNIAELKAESATALKINEEENIEIQNHLKENRQLLKLRFKEKEFSSEETIRELKKEHDNEMHDAREKFSKQLEDQRNLYQKKLKELREEMDLQRKNELHETEERKNNQINNLMRNHEKAFANIKNYYNDITLNNLALINTLKEQLDEKRKKEERLEKQAADLVSENRRLTEPLHKALEENTEMKRQVANCEKDKIVLRQTKTLLRTCEKEKKHAEWKFDILEERFKHVERERDELYEKFVSAIHEVQQKTGLKNMLLEKRLLSLTEAIEKKEAQLSEVLTASNLDPAALASVTRKLGDILDSKNIAIKELQYELARVCKAHNDLIQACEGKMKQFGIPVEELGFKPLKTTLCTQKLGMSPAGLVSVPP